MHFIILAHDKADGLELRMSVRNDHLAYIGKTDIIRVAGPLLTEEDEPKLKGSMLLVEVADRAEVEEFVANDPYAKAGLFEKVEINAVKPFLGSLVAS